MASHNLRQNEIYGMRIDRFADKSQWKIPKSKGNTFLCGIAYHVYNREI